MAVFVMRISPSVDSVLVLERFEILESRVVSEKDIKLRRSPVPSTGYNAAFCGLSDGSGCEDVESIFVSRIFEAVEVQRAKAMIREQVEKVVISWDMDLLGHAPRYPCIDWSHDRLVWSGPLVRRPVGEQERS